MSNKRDNKSIIYQNTKGAVVWRYDLRGYYVYEYGRKNILVESFEVPSIQEGIDYLKSFLDSELQIVSN